MRQYADREETENEQICVFCILPFSLNQVPVFKTPYVAPYKWLPIYMEKNDKRKYRDGCALKQKSIYSADESERLNGHASTSPALYG